MPLCRKRGEVISRAKSHWGSAPSTAWDPRKVCGGRGCPSEREKPPTGSKSERVQPEVNPKGSHAHGHAAHGHTHAPTATARSSYSLTHTHTLPPSPCLTPRNATTKYRISTDKSKGVVPPPPLCWIPRAADTPWGWGEKGTCTHHAQEIKR